ncbi:MAG: hypothetical protein WCO21_02540 [bacterium]
MKIINESQDLMVLKSSGLPAQIAGAVVCAIGLLITFGLLSSSGQGIPFWIGLILLAIGAILIIKTETLVLSIYKNDKKIIFEKKSIIKSGSRICAFNEVRYFELQQSYSPRDPKTGMTYPMYRLVLILNTGEEIPLSSYSRAVSGFMQSNQDAEYGRRIANFSGLVFEEHRALTPGEAISAIKEGISENMEKARAAIKKEQTPS